VKLRSNHPANAPCVTRLRLSVRRCSSGHLRWPLSLPQFVSCLRKAMSVDLSSAFAKVIESDYITRPVRTDMHRNCVPTTIFFRFRLVALLRQPAAVFSFESLVRLCEWNAGKITTHLGVSPVITETNDICLSAYVIPLFSWH